MSHSAAHFPGSIDNRWRSIGAAAKNGRQNRIEVLYTCAREGPDHSSIEESRVEMARAFGAPSAHGQNSQEMKIQIEIRAHRRRGVGAHRTKSFWPRSEPCKFWDWLHFCFRGYLRPAGRTKSGSVPANGSFCPSSCKSRLSPRIVSVRPKGGAVC